MAIVDEQSSSSCSSPSVFILFLPPSIARSLACALFTMFRDKLPDIEDPDYEFDDSLLEEEEEEDDYFWKDDDTDSCSSFAMGLLQITALAAFFLIGIVFGFLWHSELDSQCSRHVSQYCEQTCLGIPFFPGSC